MKLGKGREIRSATRQSCKKDECKTPGSAKSHGALSKRYAVNYRGFLADEKVTKCDRKRACICRQ